MGAIEIDGGGGGGASGMVGHTVPGVLVMVDSRVGATELICGAGTLLVLLTGVNCCSSS